MAPKKASSRACISLHSLSYDIVDSVCEQIKTISDRTGVGMTGPIPLPTKKLKVPVRKLHKRLIYIDADERAMRQLMRIQIPDGVKISIQIQT